MTDLSATAQSRKGAANTKIVNPAMKYGIALIFSIIGISGSIRLIVSESSSPGSMLALTLSIFGLLVIFFADRIEWFDFKALRVHLREVQEAKKEVEDVALALAEITAFLAAFHRRMGGEESHRIETDWMQSRVERLLDGMKADSAVRKKILYYLHQVREMDTVRESDSNRGLNRWNEIWKEVESEIK